MKKVKIIVVNKSETLPQYPERHEYYYVRKMRWYLWDLFDNNTFFEPKTKIEELLVRTLIEEGEKIEPVKEETLVDIYDPGTVADYSVSVWREFYEVSEPVVVIEETKSGDGTKYLVYLVAPKKEEVRCFGNVSYLDDIPECLDP